MIKIRLSPQPFLKQYTWIHRLTHSLPSRNVHSRMSESISLPNSSTRRRAPTLPRLPVPSLHSTLEKYLKSLAPFLLEDARKGGLVFEKALRRRAAWAEEFEYGVGKVCQQRLVELDKSSPHNWLDDNFWLEKAYLEARAPLPVNSNWWLIFENENDMPSDVLEERHLRTISGISAWQIRRAAWLLRRILEFKERVESQELYPDTTRTGLWIRNLVPTMFNICRVPARDCDHLTAIDLSKTASRRVLVMVHDWCYTIDVYDVDGSHVSYEEIVSRIRHIVADVQGRLSAGEEATPVCVLTGNDRESWARDYTYLSELSSRNTENFDTIHACLMTVCLDHYTTPPTAERCHHLADPEVDAHLHNVRSGQNGRNRWFDKPISLIVESNSRAGMMGEHSPCDALIPSIVADYALTERMPEDQPEVETTSIQSTRRMGWERLDWDVDDHIHARCTEAESALRALVADSDDTILRFEDFGGDWIKSKGFSPDAFVQIALQLAWFELGGSFTAVYETALTRLFLHGRTETIRSFTTASRDFVLSMYSSSASEFDRFDRFKKAIEIHVSLSREAATGKGIDRHLMGLRLVLKEDEVCNLFEDEMFLRSQEWKLSTSGLSSFERFRGTGFGAPYHDGYGINYAIGPDVVTFGIESKRSAHETSTAKFSRVLVAAMQSLQRLCSFELEQNVSGFTHSAKL